MTRLRTSLYASLMTLGILGSVSPGYALQASAEVSAQAGSYSQLTKLFADWRQFVLPPTRNSLPDYGTAAMGKMAAGFPAYRQRLQAIDRAGWSKTQLNDYRLVEAEMNGLDFDFRVLKPWARDPTFYATLFADWSDVPVHEGPSAQPNINLYDFRYPLDAADAKRLTQMIASIPALLAAAKDNLAASNAKDLWTYGNRAFQEQSATLQSLAAGTLVMRTLEGPIPAKITGAKPPLLRAIKDARQATDEFAAWVAAEAPKKTGPTGVGKENYNWYVANVELMPYTWDEQVTLLQRELDRSIASLRQEEVRNRALPPISPISDPAAYQAMAEAKAAKFSSFIVESGLIPDRPYVRAAVAGQRYEYTPLEKRNFFTHVTALDPLPLVSHAIHWVDLARMRNEPNASPIRRVPPLFNIYSNRSEGYATAFEEIAMQVGLYDDIPHGRELVWIALANRAARGLASLHVQSNEIDLAAAGKFHAAWTPRHWSDPDSPLVGFEQLLYARQPGYGPSYVTGKLQLDHLIAAASHAAEQSGTPFVLADTMAKVYAAGIMPFPLIEDEVVDKKAR